MSRTPEGPPPPPAVQRLRIQYAKRGRMRFTSHRDFQRAFERALRRAGIPIAHSAGFSPHPKVSYAGAAPTGVASEAEYLEIALTVRSDPADVRDRLDAALPAGLDVVDVVEGGTGSLPDRLEASIWQAELPGVESTAARAAVDLFLNAPAVQVQRLTKHGMRSFDTRPAVIALTLRTPPAAPHQPGGASGGRPRAILDMVVRHTTPAVRPDDVLAGLRHVADLTPPVPPMVTRLAQGQLDAESGTVSDPLAPDRPQLPMGRRRGGR